MNNNFKKAGNTIFYYIPAFIDTNKIIAGFSTKIPESTDNFNLSFIPESNIKAVNQNRKLFFSRFNIDYKNIICAEQIHSDGIKIVSKIDNGAGALNNNNYIKKVDALITRDKLLPITVKSADCIPIILFDKSYSVAAVIHSGWKSTNKNIISKTINYIFNRFNITPSDLTMIIGPGICKDCYEVGKEVFESFKKNFNNWNAFITTKNNKYFVDLKECIKISALQTGINNTNIYDIDICTYENNDFFSYRRDGMIGCFLTFLMLKPEKS